MLLFFLKQSNSYSFILYFIYFLYFINDTFFKNKKIERVLWDYFKVNYFYIAGACQHSGNCCTGIRLYSDNKPFKTVSDFEKKCVSDKGYKRFIPFSKGSGSLLFHCSCLDTTNRCSDYENRPMICRQYPYSLFVGSDFIHDACGYRVAVKKSDLVVSISGLQKRIKTVFLFNHIKG